MTLSLPSQATNLVKMEPNGVKVAAKYVRLLRLVI
jgi:hypothetical protein